MALATTVMGDGWKNLGGDLSLAGPNYNATFKAGDTIPLEYVFNQIKTVSVNSTAPTNGTAVNMGTGKYQKCCHFTNQNRHLFQIERGKKRRWRLRLANIPFSLSILSYLDIFGLDWRHWQPDCPDYL